MENTDNLVGRTTQAKEVVKSKIDIYQHNEILKISSMKSKVKHLIDHMGATKKTSIDSIHTSQSATEMSVQQFLQLSQGC